MPRLLKIDFYGSENADGHPIDISPLIQQTFQMNVAQRRVDFGDSFLILQNVRARGHLLLGDIVKARMNDLPDKIDRTTCVPADLGLTANEGIGRHAHFLYDPHYRVLLLQRDREVRHPAFREAVASPIHAEFYLSLIFKRDAVNRLRRMRVFRKLSFKVARPQNPEALREIDPSAGHAIDILNEHGGYNVDIVVSVGKHRRAALNRESILRLATGLLGRRGDDVRSIVVSGREDEEGPMEIIDLLEDRLIFEQEIDFRRRKLDPRQCENALIAAHETNAQYLRDYQNPQ